MYAYTRRSSALRRCLAVLLVAVASIAAGPRVARTLARDRLPTHPAPAGIATVPPAASRPAALLTETGYLISATGAGCLTVTDSTVMMSAVTAAPCRPGSTAQSWTVPNTGTTGLVSVLNNLCLDAWGGYGQLGTQEGTYTCVSTAPNHQWMLTSAGELKGQNGYCMTLGTGSSPTLTLQTCTGSADQKWTLATSLAPVTGRLVSATDGSCLTVSNPAVMMSAVTLATCAAGSAAQTWTVPVRSTTGLVKVLDTLCLDAWGGYGPAGTQEGTYTCVPTAPNHQWMLTDGGALVGQNGYCMTVGTGTSPTMTLQTCTGGANQTWTLSTGGGGSGTPQIAVTPDGPSTSLVAPPNARQQYTFTLQNPGTASGTFTLVPSCSGVAGSACTLVSPATSSVVVAPGTPQTAVVAFTMLGAGTTAHVALRATLSGNATVTDSGYAAIAATGTGQIRSRGATGMCIVPLNGSTTDGAPFGVEACDAAVARQQFLWRDNFEVAVFAGTASEQCLDDQYANANDGDHIAVHPCKSTQLSTTGPNQQWRLRADGQIHILQDTTKCVSTAGAGTTAGTELRLNTCANAATQQWDFGVTPASPPPQPARAVSSPHGRVLQVAPDSAFTTTFVVRNGGDAAVFTHVPTCTGAAFGNAGCDAGGGSGTLTSATTDSAVVQVTATPHGYGTTGRVRVTSTPSGGSATSVDSGWVDVTTRSTAVAVLPHGQPLTGAPGIVSQAVFAITNTGNAPATYSLWTDCSGAATPGGCTLGQATISLPAGGTGQATLSFTGGAYQSTGAVRLIARSLAHPSLIDTGTVNVTVPLARTLSATPQGQTIRVAKDVPSVVRFGLKNSGNVTDSVTVSVTCTNAAMFGGCPSPVPEMQILAPTGTMTPTVSFTANTVGASSQIHLTARAPDQTVLGTAWVDVVTRVYGDSIFGTPLDTMYAMQPGYVTSSNARFKNNGSLPDRYRIDVRCGPASGVSVCWLHGFDTTTTTLTTDTIAPGAVVFQNFDFRAGNAGARGTIQFRVVSLSDTTVRDSVITTVLVSSSGSPAIGIQATPRMIGATATSAMFQVYNSGTANGFYAFTADCRWNGVTITPCTTSVPNGVWIAPGTSSAVFVNYTPGPASGVGRIILHGTLSGSALSDSAVVTASGGASVALSPESDFRGNLIAGIGGSLPFVLRNPGTGAGDYALAATCTWGMAGMPCAPTPGVVHLGPGDSAIVVLNFTTPAGGPVGQASLTATLTSGGQASNATGRYDLSIGSQTPSPTPPPLASSRPTVATNQLNPGTNIARNQCLTIAAGSDAAYECGDLRLVRALPTTTTYSTPHIPVLMYNSAHATASAILGVQVGLDSGVTADAIVATVTFADPTDSVVRSFAWNSAWSGKGLRRIAVPIDAQSLNIQATDPAHVLAYTVHVQAKNGGNLVGTAGQDTGTVVIVDRRQSPFGQGWWLDGLERLMPVDATHQLWIGGDGSTRLYTRATSTVWAVTPTVDRPDSLIAIGSTWQRHLRNGGFVEFDATGRHVATQNRAGRRTTFQYDAAYTYALTGIGLPGPGNPAYTFDHFGSPAPFVLTSVVAPPNGGQTRVTYVEHPIYSWVTTSITEPGNNTVGFVSNAGRVTRRVNRLGDSTLFAYDAAGLLAADTIEMRRGPDTTPIVNTYCAAESRSVSTCAPGPQPVTDVVTRLDGPRLNATDVTDVTRFFVNRWGAPDTVVNALGFRTRVQREDAAFPMLATRVIQPSDDSTTAAAGGAGLVTEALYNERGLPLEVRVRNPVGTGGDAVTAYAWGSPWDMPTHVTPPAGAATDRQYDPVTGDLQWAQTAGDTTKFTYVPGSPGLVQTSTRSVNGAVDQYVYNAAGNLQSHVDPLGAVDSLFTDTMGRDTLVVRSLTAAAANAPATWQRVRTIYDISDRDSVQVTSSTADSKVVTVANGYDAEGNLLSVSQTASPDPAQIGPVVRRFTYDPAGRKTAEWNQATSADVVAYHYDPAGNLVSGGRTLRYVTRSYDALNRLTDQWGDDHTHFVYDALGRTRVAQNSIAEITRTYTASGAVRTDRMRMAKADAQIQPMNELPHVYDLTSTYDSAGRRLTMAYPPQLGGGTATYTYDSATAQLATVTSPGGTVYRYHYDAMGRLDSLVRRNGQTDRVVETRSYDRRSQMTGHLVARVNGATTTTLFGETLVPRLDGKIVRANSDSTAYDGLGQVIYVHRAGVSDERFTLDALGNRVSGTTRQRASGGISTYQYTPGVGRLVLQGTDNGTPADTTSYTYDWLGNTATSVRVSTLPYFQGDTAKRLRWSTTNAYSDQNKLTLNSLEYDTAFAGPLQTGDPWFAEPNGARQSVKYVATETYRYDPLGRRILTRMLRGDKCHFAQKQTGCRSTVTRTVWDGDQMLYELRAPTDSTGIWPAQEDDGWASDPLMGRVAYVHGLGVDTPLETTKPDGLTVLPLTDWRGRITDGMCIAGQTMSRCDQRSQVFFPESNAGVFGGPGAPGANGPPSWYGTQLEGMTDGSGYVYQRNRYLDPSTGRFTQEDPIGLAGGLNLYGFAGSDPVNYADPFGLCPVGGAGVPCESVGIAAGAILGGVAGGVVTGACASATWGICAAGTPLIVGAGSGFGATVGGLVGRLADVLYRDGDPIGADAGPRAGKDFTPGGKEEVRGPEGTPCAYCGRPTTRQPGRTQSQADHVIPKSKGGNGSPDNGANACAQCNNEKRARRPSEWEPRWYGPKP